MASITQTIREQDDTGPPRFGRVDPGDCPEALGVLLTGHAATDDPAVRQFLDYSRSQQLQLDELWVARDSERVTAAALVVPCPGRASMLFCSPSTSWPDTADVVALLRHACRAQSPEHSRLIQCLVDPSQRRLAGALRDADFQDLATLKYMQGRLDRHPDAAAHRIAEQGLRTQGWSDANRDAFARAILASYEQTLDCPSLRGVRQIDDVILGHQSAGEFRPEMWSVLLDGDEPAGVVLINEQPAMDACELVYLGIAVPYRGRGLGAALLAHGLNMVRTGTRLNMMLAVDDRNVPALRLYRTTGFRENAAKLALVYLPGQDE